MRVVTKHFGFVLSRYDWNWPPRWWRFHTRIGFAHKKAVHDGSVEGASPYKYWGGIDFQVLPIFIWYRTLIHQDSRIADVQCCDRIVGIQSWPFMRFCGGLA